MFGRTRPVNEGKSTEREKMTPGAGHHEAEKTYHI